MYIVRLQSTLLYCLPAFLIAGPFLADLSISLIGLLFLVSCFYYDNKKYFTNKYIIVLFFWYIAILTSSLLSNHVLLSLESSLFYFRFILFSLGLWFVLENNVFFIKRFSYSFLFSFIFVIIDSYLQYFTSYNIFGYYYDGHRLSGPFGSESVLGAYISRLLPLFFGLIIASFSKHKFSLFLSITVLLLADVLVLLSGERTALFLALMGSILIIFLIRKFRYIRLLAFISSIIISSAILYFDDTVNKRIIGQTLNETKVLEENKYFLSEGHELLYKNGIQMFLDNPIFGIGPKNFREICGTDQYYLEVQTEDSLLKNCSTHPHNIYIQLLSETGLIGTVPILCFFILVTLILIRHFFYFFYKSKKSNLTDFQI